MIGCSDPKPRGLKGLSSGSDDEEAEAPDARVCGWLVAHGMKGSSSDEGSGMDSSATGFGDLTVGMLKRLRLLCHLPRPGRRRESLAQQVGSE
eukprot:CAMPEP_0176052544 /NCGR_PEP_ID=MMETSP0120_2-20121206/26125_1 /TAXON_ID=160619 /ORGANISM="Kryptoperidinium foliaceum, Strain CCMP 1326" /LENGTH=92 /DNA_ID=CAMNT_0017385983 /DNA_START=35 /DNA_END=311 /DNA_ORIENTATION=-